MLCECDTPFWLCQLLQRWAPDERLPVHYVFSLWSLFIADICSQQWDIVSRQLSYYATLIDEAEKVDFKLLLSIAKRTNGVALEPDFEWPLLTCPGGMGRPLGPALQGSFLDELSASAKEEISCQARKFMYEQGYIMYSMITLHTGLLSAKSDDSRWDVMHHIFGRSPESNWGNWAAKPKYQAMDGYSLPAGNSAGPSRLSMKATAPEGLQPIAPNKDDWTKPGAKLEDALAGFTKMFGEVPVS